MTPEQEAAVVAQARRWLGTPYHHAADVLGVGVDCAMLPVRVFTDAGIVHGVEDPRPYPPDWHLHRSEERYLRWMQRYGYRVRRGWEVRPGDMALFKFGRCVSHGGIVETVGADPIMIHADRDAGEVTRCEVRSHAGRFVAFWRIRA